MKVGVGSTPTWFHMLDGRATRSIRICADDLSTGAGADGIPGREIDRVLAKPDRPICHRRVGAARVIAPGGQVGARKVVERGRVGSRSAIIQRRIRRQCVIVLGRWGEAAIVLLSAIAVGAVASGECAYRRGKVVEIRAVNEHDRRIADRRQGRASLMAAPRFGERRRVARPVGDRGHRRPFDFLVVDAWLGPVRTAAYRN